MTQGYPFTIRVYGLLIHQNQILLSRENIQGEIHTKFPGGGLEFGEGLKECVQREFMEEAQLRVEATELFYLTEDFIASAFHDKAQVISVYYRVESSEPARVFTADPGEGDRLTQAGSQILYWCPLTELSNQPIELAIDKKVVAKLLR